jgi:hypothetical protein
LTLLVSNVYVEAMRLSLVQKTLDSAPIGEAALSLTPVPNQPSTLISNLHGFKKFLASVDNIPALASQVSFLKNSWAYATQQNQLQFPNTDASYHTPDFPNELPS